MISGMPGSVRWRLARLSPVVACSLIWADRTSLASVAWAWATMSARRLSRWARWTLTRRRPTRARDEPPFGLGAADAVFDREGTERVAEIAGQFLPAERLVLVLARTVPVGRTELVLGAAGEFVHGVHVAESGQGASPPRPGDRPHVVGQVG